MRNLGYRPVPSPPYVPARVLRERIAKRLEDAEGSDCIVWAGACNSQGRGVLRLRAPDGHVLVEAAAVCWFLSGRPWPADHQAVRPRCGQPSCCRTDHLALEERRRRNQQALTPEQARELVALYQGPQGAPAHRAAYSDLRDPRRIAAEACGICYGTAKRLLQLPAGHPDPRLPELLAQFGLAQKYTRERLESAERAWTLERLAARYQVSCSTLCDTLRRVEAAARPPRAPRRPICPDDAMAAALQVAEEMEGGSAVADAGAHPGGHQVA